MENETNVARKLCICSQCVHICVRGYIFMHISEIMQEILDAKIIVIMKVITFSDKNRINFQKLLTSKRIM